MNLENVVLVSIPKDEWLELLTTQRKIMEHLNSLDTVSVNKQLSQFITANQFMAAVSIRRTTFDRLCRENKIRTVKKARKIYVPITEIDRFFSDRRIL